MSSKMWLGSTAFGFCGFMSNSSVLHFPFIKLCTVGYVFFLPVHLFVVNEWSKNSTFLHGIVYIFSVAKLLGLHGNMTFLKCTQCDVVAYV